MEQLTKNVEKLRTHINIGNSIAYGYFIIFGINSIVEFEKGDSLGEKFYLIYILILMLFLTYYVYKNRTNLPFPTEITEESLKGYQKKQLKRILYSSANVVWWLILPISHGFAGLLMIHIQEERPDHFGVAIGLAFFIFVIFQARLGFNRYIKEYQELGGKDYDLWFTF